MSSRSERISEDPIDFPLRLKRSYDKGIFIYDQKYININILVINVTFSLQRDRASQKFDLGSEPS